MAQYGIYFVPKLKQRKPLTRMRAMLCSKYRSNKALQYPVHATLTMSAGIKDPQAFIRDVKEFCRNQKPRKLYPKQSTELLNIRGINWCGIHFRNDKWLRTLMVHMRRIAKKHSRDKQPVFNPHITLVYKTDLTGLKPMKVPVKQFDFNRITIVKRKSRDQKYRIYRHIPLRG